MSRQAYHAFFFVSVLSWPLVIDLRYCSNMVVEKDTLTDANMGKEKTAFNGDDSFFVAYIDSLSDDDNESDENDVLKVSCHGSDLKRMRDEAWQCGVLTMKRRRISIHLEMMSSGLTSIAFNEKELISEDSPKSSDSEQSFDECLKIQSESDSKNEGPLQSSREKHIRGDITLKK